MKTLITRIHTYTHTNTDRHTHTTTRTQEQGYCVPHSLCYAGGNEAVTVDVDDDVVYVDDENVDSNVDGNVDDNVDDFQAESLACGGWQKPHRGDLQWT